MPDYAQRRSLLRRQLANGDKLPDTILVTNYTNVSYLTGFSGDDSYLLIAPNKAIVLSDPRYTQQLSEECPDLDLEIRQPGTTMLDILEKVFVKQKISTTAIEADSMTVGTLNQLKAKLPKVEFVASSGQVETLREIKDKDEIAEIREAIAIAERAFAVVKASIRPSQTEKEVADDIDRQIRLFGGKGSAFPAIVGVGPNAALPHYRPGSKKIEESPAVLIDWGARGKRYVSDLTRVLVTSRIPPKLERMYGVALKAQLQAIAKIKPGAIMQEVDAAARDVITKAGFGKEFGHSLGHGIGLEVHESPRLAVNQSRPLKVGMVVTVEPGIYIPGFGGVRIEDDVLVTKNGHEVLTSVPKDLADCVIQTV